MRPRLVVTLYPICTECSDLIQRVAHVGIEDFLPIGSVESLDECGLNGLSRLDVSQLDLESPRATSPLTRPPRVAAGSFKLNITGRIPPLLANCSRHPTQNGCMTKILKYSQVRSEFLPR